MIDSLTTEREGEVLTVTWDDGSRSTLEAATLRREARDAWSMRERIDHGEIAVRPGIAITGLYQIGRNGVNVHFSDGHDRAIYPFPYLRELSERHDNKLT